MAYKQKPMTFGEGTGLKDLTGTKDKGAKFNGLKTVKPPRVNSIESEEKENEYEVLANDDADYKNTFVEERVSEGSEESQELLRIKNAKKANATKGR
jgi:hypothetical protein